MFSFTVIRVILTLHRRTKLAQDSNLLPPEKTLMGYYLYSFYNNDVQFYLMAVKWQVDIIGIESRRILYIESKGKSFVYLYSKNLIL